MTRHQETKRLPTPLVLFLCLVSFFTVLSIARDLIGLWHRHWQGAVFDPLAPPLAGADFYVFRERMRSVHHAAFFAPTGYQWMYPAPAVLVYAFLYLFCWGNHWIPGFAVLAATSVGGALYAALRLSNVSYAPQRLSVYFLTTLLLAWPLYISLERGNTESWLCVILALGIWAFVRERWALAAMLIGVAGAAKIYPLLCLGLFIPRKRFKEVGIGLLVASGVTLISLWYLNPDLAFSAKHIVAGVRMFTLQYGMAMSPGQGIYDHSAFEIVKVIGRPVDAHLGRWLSCYLVTAGSLFLVVALVRVWHLPLTNQVLYIIAASLLLPPVSFDYTLQNLYISWAIISLCTLRLDKPTWWHYAVLTCFSLEFAPLTFVLVNGVWINGIIKGFGLLGLTIFTAITPCHPVTPSGVTDGTPGTIVPG